MSKQTDLTTTEEFYTWAASQLASKYSAEQKYMLRDDWREIPVLDADGKPVMYQPDWAEPGELVEKRERQTYYRLEQTGGSSWRSTYIDLPSEIGEALAKAWKVTDRGYRKQFTGMRALKSILTMLDANLAKDLADKGEAAIAEQERVTQLNRRNSTRRAIAEQAQRLVDLIAKDGGAVGITSGEIFLADLVIVCEAGMEA